MDTTKTIVISRDDLFESKVEETLLHQKALERLVDPPPLPPVPLVRRILLSNLFLTPLFTIIGAVVGWMVIEPFLDDNDLTAASSGTTILWIIVFPLISSLIVMFFFVGDGLIHRRLESRLSQAIRRGAITFGFAIVGVVLTGVVLIILIFILNLFINLATMPESIRLFPPSLFLFIVALRSLLWVVLGSAIGLGMYYGEGTQAQLSNAILGGAVGSALGGLFFDPIDRFILGGVEELYISRLVGFSMVGLCVGIFVALGEQLSRVGWFKVKTGPLAGKSFVLYRDTTTIGSTAHADIYLFKDPEIDPKRALVRRVGANYEIEDPGSRYGTIVNGTPVQQRRLQSGDQISMGATVLEFEERSKRTATFKLEPTED